MKAVVLGSWGIGQAVLQGAIEAEGVEIVGVFTRPRDDSTTDPFRNLVADLAVSEKLPVFTSKEAAGEAGVDLLRQLGPDVVVSAAHPTLLSPDFIAIPRLGVLNLHGSLLPRNRGTSPVNWALIRDERETGLTLHYIDEGMDTGDLIFQERVQISDEDLPGTLADKIKALAAPMIERALRELVEGRTLPRKKQEHGAATLAPRLRPTDLLIDWNKSAREVWSFIRGTSQPNLGARATVAGKQSIIWRAHVEQNSTGRPGAVVDRNADCVVIACREGAVRVDHSAIQVLE